MNVLLKLRHPIRAHNLPKQTLTATSKYSYPNIHLKTRSVKVYLVIE